MTTLDQAAEMIAKTEAELQSLVARAAQEGRYDAVVLIAEWARTLRDLRASSGNGSQSAESQAAHALPNGASGSRGPGFLLPSKKELKKRYPAFAREGDNLVKIAWSKASKAEYLHKAPKSVVLLVAAKIVTLHSRGKLFSTEAVLPLREGSGSEIPTYQVYLVLAWLRKLGLVVQHGRQGYSVRKNTDLAGEVSAKWELLQQRRVP